MSVTQNSAARARKKKTINREGVAAGETMKDLPGLDMAVSSSLNNMHISPRTQRTQRNVDEEDVELSLLGEDERYQAGRGLDDGGNSVSKQPISAKDKRAMVLLCILCKFEVYIMPSFELILGCNKI